MPDVSVGAAVFLGFIVIQRLAELALAKRNTAKLLARGAVEHAPGHYLLIVALHSAWIAALIFLGFGKPIAFFWLAIFILLQVFRVWILMTLGERWTTRIIVLNEPLVAKGPFAYFRHPNYMLVVGEIFVAPMVLGLWQVALLFSVLNALVLAIRIRAEDQALSSLRG